MVLLLLLLSGSVEGVVVHQRATTHQLGLHGRGVHERREGVALLGWGVVTDCGGKHVEIARLVVVLAMVLRRTLMMLVGVAWVVMHELVVDVAVLRKATVRVLAQQVRRRCARVVLGRG